MHRKVCLLVALLGLLVSFNASAAESDFNIGGGLGLTQIGEDFFLTTTVTPDFSIGKLGLGLELTLNFNKDGIRIEDWDTTGKKIARSIRYIRWAHKGDPLYLQLGTLNNAVIGTGILVDNYMNSRTGDIVAGQRRLGLAADVDLGLGGVEALLNDTLSPTMYAGRVYLRPATFIPLLSPFKKLSVGVSMATDKRVESPYNELQAQAVDVFYPVHPAFILYAHAAQLSSNLGELGSGRGAGFKGALGPINYVAEARSLDPDFVSTPFSKKYEQEGIDWTKYDENGQRTEGYMLGANLNLMSGDLVIGVKQEFNPAAEEGKLPRITGDLLLKGSTLKMVTGGRDAELNAHFTKEIVDPTEGDANAYLSAKAKIAVMRGAYLNYNYDVVYQYPFDTNAEPLRNTSVGLTVEF